MLEGLVKRTRHAGRLAKYKAELACPPLPQALSHLWLIFNRLRRRKGGNGFSQLPIGWGDIDAFLRQARIELAPWEIEIIEDLDDLFLADHSKAQLEID